jgi:sec-independent protein translocase protein TatA
MFNLGPWELAIVGVVAILLFGKRLPEVMRSLGKSYNEFRKGLSDIQSSINYSDYHDTSSYSSNNYSAQPTSSGYEEFEEPTAPKFEMPPATPDESATPSGDINKPIEEKSA